MMLGNSKRVTSRRQTLERSNELEDLLSVLYPQFNNRQIWSPFRSDILRQFRLGQTNDNFRDCFRCQKANWSPLMTICLTNNWEVWWTANQVMCFGKLQMHQHSRDEVSQATSIILARSTSRIAPKWQASISLSLRRGRATYYFLLLQVLPP